MRAWALQGAQVCLKNPRNYSGILNILVPPLWFSTVFHACHTQGQAHMPTHMCVHTHTHWVSLPILPHHPPYPPWSQPTFLLLITEPFYLFNCSIRFIKLLPCCAMLSHFSHVQLFATLWTIAYQAPLSRFSRQEYWSRLPCSLSGGLLNPGIQLVPLISPALAGGFFTTLLCLVTLSCPTFCDLMYSSPQSALSMGILQARILEWVAMPSSRGSSQSRD